MIQLTKNQIKPAVRTLTRAFYSEPLHVIYFSETSMRDDKLHYLCEYNIRYCLKKGEVYATSPNFEGVALWELVDPQKTPQHKPYPTYEDFLVFKLVLGVGKEAAKKILSYNYVILTHYNLVTTQHWYFYVVGVDPTFQGKGYASKLIKPILARIDKENLPCYLDTNYEKTVKICQHYGFKVIKKYQIPVIGITNWSMLREPPL